MIKTYSKLITFQTFEERFRYLKACGVVGELTFGWSRYLNQEFYASGEWKMCRRAVIIRDGGFDLAIDDDQHEIPGLIIVHHMNELSREELERGDFRNALDPEFLISTAELTHKAIHYGDESLLPQPIIVRRPNDTIPWKQ